MTTTGRYGLTATAVTTVILVTLVQGHAVQKVSSVYKDDQFCSKLGCCEGRHDSFSLPINGTRCYCDNFCTEKAKDCCPDYYFFCFNIKTPPTKTNCDFSEILVTNMNDENVIKKKIDNLKKELKKFKLALERILIERCFIEEAKQSLL